jgi:hypothetical protein
MLAEAEKALAAVLRASRVISPLIDCALWRTLWAARCLFSPLFMPAGPMSLPCAVIVADNIRLPGGSGAHRRVPGVASYEAGHSERQVTGSVAAAPECRWSATLAVPMIGDQSVLITIEREGPAPAGVPTVADVSLVIPPGEVDAVMTLLRGLVGQARSEGVLPRRVGR